MYQVLNVNQTQHHIKFGHARQIKRQNTYCFSLLFWPIQNFHGGRDILIWISVIIKHDSLNDKQRATARKPSRTNIEVNMKWQLYCSQSGFNCHLSGC